MGFFILETTEIVTYITDWLLGYCKQSGVKGWVVGVSGGIDSAVTSALCARTKLPVICVEMPIHQPESQQSRAHEHIELLKKQFNNVQSECIDLSQLYDNFVATMPYKQEDIHEMALINSRARIRMTTLYFIAGCHDSLVVGTGNKIEDFGVGFFTKYGDGGVDISPIADLTKSEVYELASSLNIIQQIVDAPPTDGLWGDDRTDEDQIGASYPELEWAMRFNGDNSILSQRQKEVLTIFRRLNAANRHKMIPIPTCKIPNSLRNE